MMSGSRTGTQLSQQEILTLELWYRTTPMTVREMCQRMDVKYTAFQAIRKKYFPDAVKYQMSEDEALKTQIKLLGLTKEDIEDLRELYINSNTPLNKIYDEYNLTEWDFEKIRKAYFPEYARTGFCHAVINKSDGKDENKQPIPKPRLKLEIVDDASSRLSSQDKMWLEKNWHFAAAEKKKKTAVNRHTRGICSSGRRFG